MFHSRRLLPFLLVLFTLVAGRMPLFAQTPGPCDGAGHILQTGDTNTDLDIAGYTCTVDGSAANGTYIFRNINVHDGGTLHFQDKPINLHARSILIESGGTLEAGADAPITGPLSIFLYGAKGDPDPSITCKNGPTCGVPQKIWDSNPNVAMSPMVMPTAPCTPASNYLVGTPVGSDCFYQYEIFEKGDAAGAFFGKKVLAVSYGGSLYLRGRKGIRDVDETGLAIDANPSDSGTSWARLTQTISSGQKGATTLTIDRPVPTWKTGDQIVVTSTDYLPGHSEVLTLASDPVNSGSGATLTVAAPGVQFPHWGEAYNFADFPDTTGPRDDPKGPNSNNPALSRHLENRAVVALLTRSILIDSEGSIPVMQGRPTGPNDPHFPLSDGYYGGHTVVRQGFKLFQVQGVEFANLGQGGEIGHYPIHFHMDRKVPQPTTNPYFGGTYLADSSIHDSNTRFVTIHATQGLLIARNVGYRSIGHGYYLEDATEVNNRLYSNVGIQAVAAVDSGENPRRVPGIFSQPGRSEAEVVPFHSDYDHPSLFWIMNTWNDFRYNVAVGAGTCGVCYWMLPGANSGYSVYETWDSYAAIQGTPGRAGAAPLMTFIGNSCSAAMTALQTTGETTPCFGVTSSDMQGDSTKLHAVVNPTPPDDAAYPYTTALRQKATFCAEPSPGNPNPNCLTQPLCTGTGSDADAYCAATVIDHFSTSFNWGQFNYAAVLLRNWWFLFTDSSITDVQNGGLQMPTGGGYSRADIAQGFWNLSSHNLFVGNTQPIPGQGTSPVVSGVPDNPFASNAGPFNPYALNNASNTVDCPYNALFCISKDQGIAFENATFSNSQRMLHIYDGPTFEDSDAFADIHPLDIGSLSECRPDGNQSSGNCTSLGWMNAYVSGVLQSPPGNNLQTSRCVLPNAAISWKQSNGFYYPPAFDSQNLYFDPSVAIRHFVIDPLWIPGGFQSNPAAAMKTYCTWQATDFSNFTDIDRETELTDLDGSLTGLLSKNTNGTIEPTISVNNDPIADPTSVIYDPNAPSNFFNGPVITPECESSIPKETATVNTSPYEYVTTVIFPACLANGTCGNNWGTDCGSQLCYGVPLYRQFLTDTEFTAWEKNKSLRPFIRMMGQNTGQRSTLSVNHARYYFDTTVPMAVQNPDGRTTGPNVFQANASYWVFLLYAKPSLHQTYSFYIGRGMSKADAAATVTTGTVNPFPGTVPTFDSEITSPDWIVDKEYDTDTGVLSVTIDLSEQGPVFQEDLPKLCQPESYCTMKTVNSKQVCGCKPGSNCTDETVCAWGSKEIDCPLHGCFGFQITLPPNFQTATPGRPIAPPDPLHFFGDQGSDSYFENISFQNADKTVAGSCYYGLSSVGGGGNAPINPVRFPIPHPRLGH